MPGELSGCLGGGFDKKRIFFLALPECLLYVPQIPPHPMTELRKFFRLAHRAGAGQEFPPMLPFPKRRGPQRLHSHRPTRRPLALEPLEDRTLPAATITVNSTLDTNDPSDSLVTLREAILIANGTRAVSPTEMGQVSGTLGSGANDRDTIAFNIPGTGVHTIQPATVLPEITDPVIIDGYTQPGASPNTLAVGTNAVLNVELSGSQIPFVNGPDLV
jgi:hypothetical protein